MNNNKIKKIAIYALISIFVIINSKNIVFADNNYNENDPNLNKFKIDKNLNLYVSGSGILIYGELINPLSIGCVNEELTDIPKDCTLKSIKYKNPSNNKIIEIKDVSTLHEINLLFKYPDNMKIDLIILDNGKMKKISTDILNLRNHQWTMNVGAGGTLTFITEDKKYFGILGHDYFNDTKFKNIKVYTTKDVYINKDSNSLSGISKDQYIGYVTHSSKEGTFGVVEDFDKIPIIGKYGIAPLGDVKKGEAYIVAQNPKIQECEKIKVNILGKDGLPLISNIYSIVYKLDKESITTVREKVGRGYSGSPIIQNEKIIGATSVGYNLNKDNKLIYYSIGFLGKYTGGIDIYKYLYRLNNLTDEYKIIK